MIMVYGRTVQLSTDMILNNFGAIILKRKQIKPLFKIFIKQYQEQIAFIEQTMKQDAQQIKQEATCCYCIFRRMNCFGNKHSAKFEMCNPQFYRVFSEMGSIKRQEYFIELLNYIQLIGDAYHQYSENKDKPKGFDINQYKTHISTVLLEKFISKQVVKELQVEQQHQICLDLLVVIDRIKSQKVGRLKNFKFQLIEKKNGVQQKILINLKNYLVVSYSVDTLNIVISTIYETITPLNIEISFAVHRSDTKYQKYLRIFTEITKIGKIQKLIRNIDLFKVFGKDHNDQDDNFEGKNSSFLKSFVKQQQAMEFFHQKNFVDSQDIIRKTVNTQKKIKRLQTIRQIHHEQIKRKLIETLNFLSEKKERQNEKVKSFKNKPPISRPKQKSEAIQRVLKSTQAFIPRRTTLERRLTVEELPKELVRYVLNIENQDQKLSIINRNNSPTKHKEGREKHDSFFVDSNQNISNTQQKFNRMFRLSEGQVAKKIQYNRNIYNKLYPQNFKFARVESLMEMINVQFKPYYVMPEEDVAKQSNNLAGDKLAKFKVNWLDKLTKTIRVFCRKQSPNFIKIFIPLAIEIRSLVQAVVNVEAFPLWHPNIKNVEIVSVISTENAIIYRMEVINPITNKLYTLMMLMHLFRVEGKYYIIQKSIEDLKQEKKDKGILSFFSSKKSSNNFSKINFLMMRISNTNKNGSCEMTISFDYQPIDPKMAKDARKEQMTLFLNYIFIVNFWKLSAEKKTLNTGIFNFDWMVSMKSFDEQDPLNMKAQEPDIFDDAKVEISRLVERNEQKENVQSSSQLIHSSEFHDV